LGKLPAQLAAGSSSLTTFEIERSRRSQFNVEDILSQSPPEIMQIVLEYGKLATLINPSEAEADRLADILADACENDVLSFWLAEVDHCLGHHLGLLDEDDREDYLDQQALLRERFGQSFASAPTVRPSSLSRFSIRPKPVFPLNC
jgi:hypothetical protein